jgi:hypothetical protein
MTLTTTTTTKTSSSHRQLVADPHQPFPIRWPPQTTLLMASYWNQCVDTGGVSIFTQQNNGTSHESSGGHSLLDVLMDGGAAAVAASNTQKTERKLSLFF